MPRGNEEIKRNGVSKLSHCLNTYTSSCNMNVRSDPLKCGKLKFSIFSRLTASTVWVKGTNVWVNGTN